MIKVALTVSLLFISVATMAQTYSDANLNGTYSYQIQTPQAYTWTKTFACPSNSTITYTAVGGATTAVVGSGSATFDGAGSWSGTSTTIGKLNATASANTMSVTWNTACQVTKVNTGHIVYAAASSTTVSGTYSIGSTGSGTLVITGQDSLSILLASTNSSGVSATAFLASIQQNGQGIGSGTAVLQ